MPENNVTDQEKHAYINHIDQQLQQLDFIVYDRGCCCQVARRKHRVTDKIIKIAFEAYVKGVYNRERYIALTTRADNVIREILHLFMICQGSRDCDDPLKWKKA